MRDMCVNKPVGIGPAAGPTTPPPTTPAQTLECTTDTTTVPKAPGDQVSVLKAANTVSQPVSLMGSEPPAKAEKQSPHPKGTIFADYGYNRDNYSNSTVHFTGDGYDFTLHNVTAQDKPAFGGSLSNWAGNVLKTHPDIPQANYRVGFFITDRTSISFSGDHMKYHMRPQQANVTGHVSQSANQQFAGDHNGMEGVGHSGNIVSDLQHCDGLNLAAIELAHYVPIVQTQNGNAALEAFGTVAAGVMITDTRANVFSETSSGEYDGGAPPPNQGGWTNQVGGAEHAHTHAGFVLDGFGASAGAGVQATFFKHMYIRAGVKTGFSSLHGFHTIDAGRGSQNIGWVQRDIAIGMQFPIGQHKKK